MRQYIPGLILALAVLALVALLLKPTASVIDLSPQAAAQITQRYEAAQQTARARIAADVERTKQRTLGTIIAVSVVGAVLVLGYGLRTWGHVEEVRAAAQPTIPPHLLAEAAALLAAKPGRTVDVVDGDWYVVDDAEQVLYPLALPGPAPHWSRRD